MNEKVVYIHPRGLYRVVEYTVNGQTLTKTIMMNNADRREWLAKYGGKADPATKPVSRSPKKIFKEVEHENYMAGLMNCRKIDKFFGHDHKFTPVQKPGKLPGISEYNAAMKLLEPDVFIRKVGTRRVLVSNDIDMAFVESRVLRKLCESGRVILVSSHGETEIYKSPIYSRDFIKAQEENAREVSKNAKEPVLPHVDPPTRGATPPSPLEVKKRTLSALVKWRKSHADNCEEMSRVIGHFEQQCEVKSHDKTESFTEFYGLTNSEFEELKELYWAYPGATMFVGSSEGNIWNGRFYIDL